MKEKVAVIGAGVIGLKTALEAQRVGFDVTIYTAEPPLNTTSAKAGAVFEPYRPGRTPVPEVTRFLNVGIDRYREMDEHFGEKKTGVKIDGHDVYLTSYGNLNIEQDLPFLAGFKGKCESISRGDGQFIPGEYKSAILLRSVPSIDPLVTLDFLQKRFSSLGGRFAPFQKIENAEKFVSQTPEEVIFNCTGLAAQDMMKDTPLGMEPMRGQILVANFMTDWGYSILCVDDAPVEYQFPRNGVTILGGTTEKGESKEVTTPEEEQRIFEAAKRVIPELKWENIKKTYAGIRPYSENGAYIKMQDRTDGKIHIVSTGFGGSGWTFGFGAAEKAVSMVRPLDYDLSVAA